MDNAKPSDSKTTTSFLNHGQVMEEQFLQTRSSLIETNTYSMFYTAWFKQLPIKWKVWLFRYIFLSSQTNAMAFASDDNREDSVLHSSHEPEQRESLLSIWR
jgi:hypothetical protein